MIQLEMRYDDTMYEVKLVKRQLNGNIKIQLTPKEKKKNGIFRLFERKRNANNSYSGNGNSLCVLETKEQAGNTQGAIKKDYQARSENGQANRESESGSGEAGRNEKGECKE